ncbi:MAG: flagellar basal body rod protein FlgC [Candidatus Riflebacteria bacterium]|nr:flagellar basal body rod protein FlgC [Candidatus Riflebacteria bacterium]
MGIFNSINISATGLSAERLRMDVISNNIANVNTTRTEDGGPFRRQMVIFQSIEDPKKLPMGKQPQEPSSGRGVRVKSIMEDMSPFKMEYDPENPDADADGYVRKPNETIVHEMVDMITCTRAYEANVTCINSAKDITSAALSISKN